MSTPAPIRRALISVFDKTGVVEFARALHDEFGIEIISTGGTARALREADIPVTMVEQVTGFPEMMDGRVKTLHPRIHAAILADRDNPEHMRQLAEQGIEPIDMVVVNLYPFERTIADPECTPEQAIEMIDIGGPCLLRAAAKNHRHVLVVTSPNKYDEVLSRLRNWQDRSVRGDLLRSGGFAAFWSTCGYDGAIAQWLSVRNADGSPIFRAQRLISRGVTRYGENPHQRGEILEIVGGGSEFSLASAGANFDSQPPLSFNNYVDASAALELCAELTRASSRAVPGCPHSRAFPARNEPRASARAAPDRSEPNPHTRSLPSHEPRALARTVLHTQQGYERGATIFQEPDHHTPTWLLTWTTYGTWLPGDERGFVSRTRGTCGEHVINNIPGTLYDANQKDVEESAREHMHGKPVSLRGPHVATIVRAFAETAAKHNIALIALSIMPDHVHVLCQAEQDGATLMQLFKGVSSRRLSQAHELPNAPRWWTKSGSRRFIAARSDMQPAVNYVCAQKDALFAGSFLGCPAAEAHVETSTARAKARGSGEEVEGDAERCDTARAKARGSSSLANAESPEGGRGVHAAAGTAAVCCFIKHTNACGTAIAPAASDARADGLAAQIDAYRRAYLGDPNAAMGGILAVNFPVTAEFAAAVMETYQRWGKPLKEAGEPFAPGAFFLEVWIAPSFEPDAERIIRGQAEPTAELPQPPRKAWGERVRLLAVGDMAVAPDPGEMDRKRVAGGVLMQTRDLVGLDEEQWRVVTRREPTAAERDDLRLAWLVCKHTKSNAITICKDGMLLGSGAGQMSRVMSCRIATWLARDNGHADRLRGAVAASDAFFPFRDGPDILADAGVTAIIQPGGSKRDQETIDACDERGVAMVFTGTRHFRH